MKSQRQARSGECECICTVLYSRYGVDTGGMPRRDR